MARDERLTLNRMRDKDGRFGPKANRWHDKDPLVLIWSGEHQAWWRPDACGYTTEATAAGHFSFRDAFMRTRHCGPEKQIVYVDAARRAE